MNRSGGVCSARSHTHATRVVPDVLSSGLRVCPSTCPWVSVLCESSRRGRTRYKGASDWYPQSQLLLMHRIMHDPRERESVLTYKCSKTKLTTKPIKIFTILRRRKPFEPRLPSSSLPLTGSRLYSMVQFLFLAQDFNSCPS